MKIAFKHLLRFLPTKPSLSEVSNKLFQLGHEHEINDEIFDIEFTPNRGDCLSLLGLARDLNSFFETNLDLIFCEDKIENLELDFLNLAPKKCPHISFLNIVIQDDVIQYKRYLDEYFLDLNLQKKNFFTDVSNFIAYEMGQPTHSYDFEKVGASFSLKDRDFNKNFDALDGSLISLRGSELVFTKENETINLAGIMGGNSTACNNSTKNALIECAFFWPHALIGNATKHNLISDASYKFERGVDPSSQFQVLRRFIQVVKDHTQIKHCSIYKNSYEDIKETYLDKNVEIINDILGYKISEQNYESILERLGFEVDKNIRVPSFRSDIRNQNDLAEEIARVIGYDNIPVKKIYLKKITQNPKHINEQVLRNLLVANGFSEVINFPFTNEKNKDSIEIDNPIDLTKPFMRTNLFNSFVDNLSYNEKRQQDSIKLFEISDIYTSSESTKKVKRLGIIISGRKGKNYQDFSQKLDDKYLSDIFSDINIKVSDKIKLIERDKVDSKTKTKIFYLEMEIDDLYLNSKNLSLKNFNSSFVKYKPVSDFPLSTRDLSFSIRDSSKIEKVINTLKCFHSDIIKESYLFDFFENSKTNEVKVGYRFIFQSQKGTLTDKQIDKIINKVIGKVISIKSVELPGS